MVAAPAEFLDHALDEARDSTAVQRAYAQAVAMDPEMSPEDFAGLRHLRDARLRELGIGGLHRQPHRQGRMYEWRRAYAHGQATGDDIRAWIDGAPIASDAEHDRLDRMVRAYEAWQEWRQSADAPPPLVAAVQHWILHGRDDDLRAAFLALETPQETAVRSVRARPDLYRFVGPVLDGCDPRADHRVRYPPLHSRALLKAPDRNGLRRPGDKPDVRRRMSMWYAIPLSVALIALLIWGQLESHKRDREAAVRESDREFRRQIERDRPAAPPPELDALYEQWEAAEPGTPEHRRLQRALRKALDEQAEQGGR